MAVLLAQVPWSLEAWRPVLSSVAYLRGPWRRVARPEYVSRAGVGRAPVLLNRVQPC